MISAWLDLPVAGVFAVLLVVYGLTAAAIVWITFWSPVSAAIRTCTGLSASFFASVSVLFALLTGFLAGDVVDRNKQATRAVEAETGALASLHALTLVAPADMATISEALRSYVDAIVNDEWNAMADGRPSPKTNTALTELLRTVADPKIAPAATQSVRDGLINLSLRAAASRSDRLALNSYQSDNVKWATVLFLCLMTQLAIAAVHLERPRAHILALTIFSLAAVVSLGLIAIQESPFDGAVRVSPAPLIAVLKTLTP